MTLDEFIEGHMEPILASWEEFVTTLAPCAGLSRTSTRDDGGRILDGVLREMRRSAPGHPGVRERRPGKQREEAVPAQPPFQPAEAWDLDRIVAEHHALRRSVMLHWLGDAGGGRVAQPSELASFNEALDHSLAWSITRYGEELHRSRELFLGILGHDLRTPVGAILMSAEFMLMDENLPSMHVATTSCILRSAKRIRKIVADMIDFIRTRLGGELPLECKPMDLRPICEHVVQEARVLHHDRTVLLTMDDGLEGNWDEARIGQMLANVLAHASEHASAETPVSVSVRSETDSVLIRVHNEGEVIPPAELARVFEPLERMEGSSRRRDGLGLGLFIARTIAQGHHGSIDVESSRKQGTTFRICLPRNTRH